MKNQPSDIVVPRELETEEGRESYVERLCILSEGGLIDENMKSIARSEALSVDLKTLGILF